MGKIHWPNKWIAELNHALALLDEESRTQLLKTFEMTPKANLGDFVDIWMNIESSQDKDRFITGWRNLLSENEDTQILTENKILELRANHGVEALPFEPPIIFEALGRVTGRAFERV